MNPVIHVPTCMGAVVLAYNLDGVKKLNPNAVLRNADIRCGKRCAVFVVSDHDQYGVKCTDFLPLEQLEQYLLGVFHANDFYSKIRL